MNLQNLDDQFSDELSQAIRSTASMEVPSDAVQRVISQSVDLAHARQPVAPPQRNGKFYLKRYLIPLCMLVAFLVPIAVGLFKEHLGFIPGWEQPSVRGAFAGAASITLGFLAWSFGQHYIGAAPRRKRSATTIGWLARVSTAILACWALAGFFTPSANLYAQMHATLKNVRTIQYVMTMSDSKTGKVQSTYKNYIVEPNLTRADVVHDGLFSSTLIMDLDQKKCLTLDNEEKTAEFLPLYQINEMQENWNKAHDFLRTVNPRAKSIGDSTVDGQPCEDFRLMDLDCETVVSISKETKLPLQMKMHMPTAPQFESVVNQFIFDEPLDPKLFSLKAPEGYKVTKIERRDPVDDSNLELLPGKSFGPATFGMTVEQAIEVLGQPDQTSAFADTIVMAFDVNDDTDPADALKTFKACTLNYASRGFQLSIGKEKGLFGVHCFGMFTGERIFEGQISGQIKMGDSPEMVRKVLGEPTRKPNFGQGESASDLLYKLPNGSTLRFAFEDSKLALVINHKLD